MYLYNLYLIDILLSGLNSRFSLAAKIVLCTAFYDASTLDNLEDFAVWWWEPKSSDACISAGKSFINIIKPINNAFESNPILRQLMNF